MTMMRAATLVLVLAAACGKKDSAPPSAAGSAAPAAAATSPAGAGTPAGPVGAAEDLRKHLKPEVAAKAPADDKATAQAFPIDLHGVAAKVVWHTFDDGPNKYLLSVGLEVVTPAAGVTVEREPAMNPANAGTESAIVEEIPLKLRWTTPKTGGIETGEVSVRIKADGTAEKI